MTTTRLLAIALVLLGVISVSLLVFAWAVHDEAVTAAARSEKNRVLNCYMVHVMKQPPHPFCADFDFRTPK